MTRKYSRQSKLMNNKKKTAIIASVSGLVLAGVIGVTLSSTNAIFKDKVETNTNATAGDVTIAKENVTITDASSYAMENKENISQGRYDLSEWTPSGQSVAIGTSNGTKYLPTFVFAYHKLNGCNGLVKDGVCETCGSSAIETTQVGSTYLFPQFFRTSDGEVAYCMDYGKEAPNSASNANMCIEVTDSAKRILSVGYPSKSGSHYGISDQDLEWATQMALYIIEGKTYDINGNVVDEDGIKLSDFGNIYTPATGKTSEANNVLKTIETLVAAANDNSINVDSFTMNLNLVETQVTADDKIKAGPYIVNTNISGNATLTASDSSVKFINADGTEISSIANGQEFYVMLPSNLDGEVKITASMNKTIPSSYYFWTGTTKEQKMLVATNTPASVSTYVSVNSELMPGDVLDIKWNVENAGNKSIVTRNTVYLYWDYGTDETSKEYGNGLESTFLYKQNISKDIIQGEMLTKNQVSSIPTEIVTISDSAGKSFQALKYVILGDALDGVGQDAEIGDAREVNYESYLDDSSTTSDLVSFKIALSQYANAHTSGHKLKAIIITEAMQFRNTSDAQWQQVSYTETIISQ